jgi:flagellar operon protein
MRLRGLSFDQQALAKIQGAVDRAAAKGAQNALVLSDAAALIVSVKNNVVVTVMDKSQLKENVFTNIDSAVFA